MYYTKEKRRLYDIIERSIEEKAIWTDTDVLDVLQAEIGEEAEKESYYWDIMTNYGDDDVAGNTVAYAQAKMDWEYSHTRLTLMEDMLIALTCTAEEIAN